MGDAQKKTHQTIPKTTRHLLGCFGFFGEQFSKKKSLKIIQTDHSKRKNCWFSWTRCHMNKSGTKTVPFDSTAISEKKIQNNKTYASKSKLKWKIVDKTSSKHQSPVANHKILHQIPAATDGISKHEASKLRPHETIHRSAPEENIILENGKHLDNEESPKDDTLQKRLSFRRKKDALRTGFSQPGSPEVKPESGRTASMSRSTSFTIPTQDKPAPNPPANSQVMVRRPQKVNNAMAKNLDPLVGMSVVIVTLLIMLIWGRLCAVLCTCAWLYFIPRLRTVAYLDGFEKNGLISGEPDFDSKEYKKKVVLEGFLERNHRFVT